MTNKNQGMRTFYIAWIGQSISTLGTGLTAFAIGVWLFMQTEAVTPLAFLLLFKTLPVVLLSPVAGALVDRWDRRTALILSDTGAAISTLLLALLFLFTNVPLWALYALVAFAAACESFQRPAWLAGITELVPEQKYGQVAGIAQVAQGATEIIAPLIAGFLINAIGVPGILLIDVITFLIAVTTLLSVRFPVRTAMPEATHERVLLSEIMEGIHYLRGQSGLVMLLVFFMLVSFQSGIIGALAQPLILSFSSPQVLGVLFTLAGSGFMAGSILLSMWGGPKRRSVGVVLFTLVFGVFLVLLGLRPSVWLVAIAATGAHFCIPLINGLNQAIWQGAVALNIQGRVFAFKEMATRLALMLAYIVAGPLADKVFGPMLMPDGVLANSLGSIFGVGTGRGMGLAFSLSGLMVVLIALLGLINPSLSSIDHSPVDSQQGLIGNMRSHGATE